MSQTSLRREVDRLSESKESPLDNDIYREVDESIAAKKAKAQKMLENINEAYFDVSCSLHSIAYIIVVSLLEALGIGFLLCLPAGLAFLLTDDPQYDLKKIKYGMDPPSKEMNSTMEFIRFSIFAALIYGCCVLLHAAARVVPLLVRRSWHILKTPLPNSLKITLAGWRFCRHYLVFAAMSICCLALFDTWIYSGSALDSMNMELSEMTEKAGFTSFSRFLERLLVSLSMLALMITASEWLMHFVTQSYRKAALATRINDSNKKYHIIAQLVRLTALGSIDARRSLKREKLRNLLQASRDELIKLTPDTAGLHLKDEASARSLARKLWTAICPFGRDYIVAEDLRAFFSDPVEAAASFRAFDEAEIGLVNQAAFESALAGFQQQRANLQASVQMSDRTLAILSRGLSFLVGLVWISAVVWLYNQSSYPLLVSLGTFIFTFSFLFKDTAKLVFDCFVFILAVHPFDIGDHIVVDKNEFKVTSIGLFSTKLERLSDGVFTHFPNGQLVNKSILNRERSGIVTDSLLITMPASTSLKRIVALQKQLKAYLESTFSEFTGNVAIAPVEFASDADKMSVRVECKYTEAEEVEREVKVLRKEQVSAKIQEFLQVI